MTVAMWLAQNGIIPSNEWLHKSDMQNCKGNTVAMMLGKNKINIPKEWYHNKELKNNKRQTVYDILK